MNQTNNPNLTAFSKKLRKEMTKEERCLWYDFLKSLPVTINRQKVLGSYIVDFYCAQAMRVIELDGSQHYNEECHANDQKRDQYLQSLGLTILRFSNYDVAKNFSGVCTEILKHIDKLFVE